MWCKTPYLRAFKFFGGFHGSDSRAWLLAIVRNTCYTWLRQTRAHELDTPFDEELHGAACEESTPEILLLAGASRQALRAALEDLPARVPRDGHPARPGRACRTGRSRRSRACRWAR